MQFLLGLVCCFKFWPFHQALNFNYWSELYYIFQGQFTRAKINDIFGYIIIDNINVFLYNALHHSEDQDTMCTMQLHKEKGQHNYSNNTVEKISLL